MYATELKTTDDFIRILKNFDDREKLRIISALSQSMLVPPEDAPSNPNKESPFAELSNAWDDGVSVEDAMNMKMIRGEHYYDERE